VGVPSSPRAAGGGSTAAHERLQDLHDVVVVQWFDYAPDV
jgi:hypothetical protein